MQEILEGAGVMFTPSKFVENYNAALETVFPLVGIEGELANFSVNQGKFIFADIADSGARLRLFGMAFRLRQPVEDGMRVRVIGRPRLHPQFGLSINIEDIRPIGEGSIKKAAALLEKKLQAEGLFEPSRKRAIAKYPQRIGVITAKGAAGWEDFKKIMNARWSGVEVIAAFTRVQGEGASDDIERKLRELNEYPESMDAIVMVRGGGSPEDLAAFNDENLVRAVAASRTPVVTGVGHEIDVVLAQRAADLAASTPSNAAELLFPSRAEVEQHLYFERQKVQTTVLRSVENLQLELQGRATLAMDKISENVENLQQKLDSQQQILSLSNPMNILAKGYALVSSGGKLVRSKDSASDGQELEVRFYDGSIIAEKKGVK